MTYGFDTSFLLAAEVSSHLEHAKAKSTLSTLFESGDRIALAPQVLAEFVHVVTNPRHFDKPLDRITALSRAEAWWNSAEVEHIFPDDEVVLLFLEWMTQFQIGRKRILDTLLAATFRTAGIDCILTTNARDFTVFGGFRLIVPGE